MSDQLDNDIGSPSHFQKKWLAAFAETQAHQFLLVVAAFCLAMMAMDVFYAPASVSWLSCPAYGVVSFVTVTFILVARRQGWSSRGFAAGLQFFAAAAITAFMIFTKELGIPELRAAVVSSSFMLVIIIMYILTPILTRRLYVVFAYTGIMTISFYVITNAELYRVGFAVVFLVVAFLIKRQMVLHAVREAATTYEARHWAKQHELLKLEGDLAVARRVQDSFSMPDHVQTPAGLSIRTYVRKFGAVGGDWVSHRSTGIADYILVVDATGKGIQASLVVHAIQSLWADAHHGDTFDPEAWFERVNQTLLLMGRDEPQSATAAILEVGAGRLRYWSAGHLPLFVVNKKPGGHKVKTVTASGNPLGVGKLLQLTMGMLAYSLDADVHLFLGTDGFFTSLRPDETLMFDLTERLPREQAGVLDGIDVQDDKTLIWVTAASAAAAKAQAG